MYNGFLTSNGHDDWIFYLDIIQRILCNDCGIEPQKYAETEIMVIDNLTKVFIVNLHL
jgi:hypothetical protein